MAKKPPRFDPDAVRKRLQSPAESSPGTDGLTDHPARASEGPRTATDHILVDPADIVLSGPYVRVHVDADELAALAESIRAGGDVKQAIGVRVEGPPLDTQYVLVYGMRRWLASKQVGLDRVPARNHGRLSIDEALALQVTENEARVDPHPVDTAVSYQMLVDQGKSQAEVAEIAGRSAGHVSYMRAVGEAILALEPAERQALYEASGATVPVFQRLATVKPLERRAEALRALTTGTLESRFPELSPRASVPAAQRRPSGSRAEQSDWSAGPIRRGEGWSIRLRYLDEELRADAERRRQVRQFLEEQLERLTRYEEEGKKGSA
jgi:ParB/RepB/Spo0J family partition protein